MSTLTAFIASEHWASHGVFKPKTFHLKKKKKKKKLCKVKKEIRGLAQESQCAMEVESTK